MQLVAEEVCVLLSRVRLIQCDTSVTRSRHDLWAAVASDQLQPHQSRARWCHCPPGVDPPGIGQARRASVRSRGARRRHGAEVELVPLHRYGDLIGGQRFNLQLDKAAERKHPREWTILGTPVPRVDMRDMVAGRSSSSTTSRFRGCCTVGSCVLPRSGRPSECRRRLDSRSPWDREGRRQRKLRRRSRAEAVAGDASSRAPQGELEAQARASPHADLYALRDSPRATRCSSIPATWTPT